MTTTKHNDSKGWAYISYVVALEQATATLTAARNNYAETITAAHDAGISLRDIAAAVGVSHQTVANIITRHRAGNS